MNEIGESEASKESYYMITLREAPSGKPTITAAQNASSTAIYLAWQPPHLATLHGEFLGKTGLHSRGGEGVTSLLFYTGSPLVRLVFILGKGKG